MSIAADVAELGSGCSEPARKAEAVLEFRSGTSGEEKAVGVVSGGQIDDPDVEAGIAEFLSQSARGVLSCQIGIECNKDGAVQPVGQLDELDMG